MAPFEYSIGTSPTDVDWAPSPEIIRLLARKTAAVMLPARPPAEASDAEPFVATPFTKAASSSIRKGSDEKLLGARLDVTLDTTAPASDFATNFTRTLSPGNFSPMLDDSRSPGYSEAFDSEGATRPPSPSKYVTHWDNIHDVPWDNSLYRPNEKDIYSKPTPKVCGCGRAFEPGQAWCSRCGTRRPVKAPDHVSQVVKKNKAMHNIDMHHSDPFERSYAWAAVYDQKQYEYQLARYEDDEEFVIKNGQFHPQLNKRSIAIAEKRASQTPIHERTEEILAKRNEYLDMRRKQVYDAEVCQECTFCPRLHTKSVGMHGRDLRALFRWDMARAHNVGTKLTNQLQAESKSCPFTPELSSKSRQMAEEYSGARSVHERLHSDANHRHVKFVQEQTIQSKLKPGAFARVADEAEKPISARERVEAAAAYGASQALLSRVRSLSPGRRTQARAIVKEGGPKSRKEVARASAGCLMARSSSAHCSRTTKRGSQSRDSDCTSRPSGSSRGTESIWELRKSKSYSVSPERAPANLDAMGHPKNMITGGKNVVKYNASFSDMIDSVRAYTAVDDS